MSNPSTPPRLAMGERLGHFEILEMIKEGGQATVYLARIARPQQPPATRLLWQLHWLGATPARIAAAGICVLKVVNPGKQDALIDEHTYLLKVRSALHQGEQPPHLISLFHSSELRNSAERQRGLDGIWKSKYRDTKGRSLEFIALPYLPGGALDSILREQQHRPLPASSAVAITLQLCAALRFLHERVGLVHHDISPSNIVLLQRPSFFRPQPPECVLIDLAAADAPAHPRLRSLIGKLIYLPPQRINRSRNIEPSIGIDPAIDVYSLGVVLYEMLAGQLPNPSIDQETGIPLPLPSLKQQRPDLSPELLQLVSDTVSHDAHRWPDLGQFQARLEATPEARQPARLRGRFDQRAIMQSLAATITLFMLVLGLMLTWAPTLSAPSPPTTTRPIATITPLPTATPLPAPSPTLMPRSTSTPAR
ncbi:MAG: hypothetical protein EI684_17165 [Candidatus Viridilinea halotolerans]|uniref:non-specific serine/threonine protein kinase n=1 Tax=Candidatus Viridilinea halotolerans TaxID=2491704 RepID=A0A426TUD9_9CHLR|nr:MAG: hypothetical protein EI684_17165 [Candidatus Viridilinea halotolerans]